jgi:hypothetical protein|tara:strand:+ start:1081 stop:1356 length:276 start_codon:yes stop_codon:yes gene_type:complete
MILEIVIGILSFLILMLMYILVNLLNKLEKTEDIILGYDEYITEFSKQIEFSDKRLKEIDAKEIFKSDDEIGWFFEQIKVIQTKLSTFKIN